MKKHLLKSLLALALVLITGNAWGESQTYTMTIDSSNNGSNNVHWTGSSVTLLTYNGVAWSTSVTGTTSFTASTTYCQVGSKNNPATEVAISTTAFAGKKILSVSLTGYCMSNTGPSLTVTAGNSTIIDGTALVKTTSTEYKTGDTFEGATLGSTDALTFTIKSSAKAAICISEISVTYEDANTPSKTLSSVTISGTPTNTTYEVGETFDPAGLTVTGTYDDASTDDLTEEVEWTFDPATFTSTSQTSVSVVASIDDVSDSYTVNDLTVNEHVVTPGEYTIYLNNTLFGIATENQNIENDQSASQNDITIVSGQSNATTNPRYDAGYVRYYAGGYMRLSVPAGYEITKIVFTAGTSNSDDWAGSISPNVGNYTDSKKTWEGNAQEVNFSFGAKNFVKAIAITYEAQKSLASIAIKTAPTKTTYSVHETFAPAGLVITATYEDDTTDDIAYADNESKFTFNPELTTALTKEDNKVTIAYRGKTVDQEITVNLIKLATPTSLEANATSTSATLTWDAVENASSYEVNVTDADAYDESFTPTTNSLLVEDLAAGTEYLWSVKAIGNNTTYADSDENSMGDFTTSALPTVAYTVSFDGNGHGTAASSDVTETEAGAGITLPACDNVDEGFMFIGWCEDQSGEGDVLEAGATFYPAEADITFYAIYKQVFTINYIVNGVNTNPQENVEGATALVFPEVSAPDADHVFCGWITEEINGTQATAPEYVNTESLTAESSETTTYYAVFAERSGSEPVEQKIQTLQYDTWTYSGSTTNKSSYRLFHKDSYIESEAFDLSKLTKVIVYGGTFGGGTYNSLTIGDGTNTWKSVEVSGSSQTGTNTYTGGTALTGTGKLRITSNSGSASSNGVRISKVEIFTMVGGYTYSNYCTTVITKQLISISLSGEYSTEFWKGETFNHEGMTVTAHYNNADDADVTNKAEFSDPDMTAAGVQTVTVTYDAKSITYDITVKTIANTKETAYTVAEAKSIIDANPAELAEVEVYVKGKISQVDSYNSTYKSITYWISEDGATTNQFEVYGGLKSNAEDAFTSKDDVKVGADVIICGKIKNYKGTYEFDANNYLVYYNLESYPATISSVGFATLYLEFDAAIPTNVTAYTATYAEKTITLHEIEGGVIPAETAVVLKGEAGDYDFEESLYTGEPLENALCGTTEESSYEMLQGTETDKYVYTLNQGDNGVGFFHMTNSETSKLAANRAYLLIPVADFEDGAGTIGFRFGDATQIENVNAAKADKYFDLMGREVLNPAGGIYILNGKKVLVK